jgi:glycosyltransferase involved in cell wall biosynthesis
MDASAVEVLVADNASTDTTAEIAAARGCVVVPVAERSIAAARNGGGYAASAEILCFVDADSRIHPRSFAAIEEAMASGRVVAGATGATMDRWSLGIAVAFAALLPIVWLFNVDTGVVFFRREDFLTVGGYDTKRRLGEDMAILLALKRLGRSRGQRFRRLRGVKAITSSRKFDDHGDWHMLRLIPLTILYLLGFDGLKRKVEDMWYRPNR